MRTMKRGMRMVQEDKQEAGKVGSGGNVEGLRKLRGSQERISLEQRQGTNNNQFQRINTCILSLT